MPNVPRSCKYTVDEIHNKPWLLEKTNQLSYSPFTCVGSRSTPEDIIEIMKHTGRAIAKKGWVVRTGDAEGADKAFRLGTNIEGGFLEVYTPQESSHISYHTWKYDQTEEVSMKLWNEFANRSDRPRWDNMKKYTRNLMTRNVCQVMGYNLETASNCLICWTPDGVTEGKNTTGETGGTGHAIRVASHFGVPVRNLANQGHKDKITRWAEDILGESLQ